MPMYEYKCHECGKIFELIQRFADTPLTVHDNCGGTVERIISAPALVFKGSGFYINDYAKGGGAQAKNSESKTSGSDSGESSSKSDSGSDSNSGKDGSSGKSGSSDKSSSSGEKSSSSEKSGSGSSSSAPASTETKK